MRVIFGVVIRSYAAGRGRAKSAGYGLGYVQAVQCYGQRKGGEWGCKERHRRAAHVWHARARVEDTRHGFYFQPRTTLSKALTDTEPFRLRPCRHHEPPPAVATPASSGPRTSGL